MLCWSLCPQQLCANHTSLLSSVIYRRQPEWLTLSVFQRIGAWSQPESAQSTLSASRWVVVLVDSCLDVCVALFGKWWDFTSLSVWPIRWLSRRCPERTSWASTNESIWSPPTSQWLSSSWSSGDASSCRRRRPFSWWWARWCLHTGGYMTPSGTHRHMHAHTLLGGCHVCEWCSGFSSSFCVENILS